MFCPKCGQEIEDGVAKCSKCEFAFSSIPLEKESVPAPQPIVVIPEKPDSTLKTKINPVKTVIYSLLALVVIVMFYVAASRLAEAGARIATIESVGGKTLEEAYYFALGSAYEGYVLIVRALGIFLASALVWMGLKKE